MLGSGGSGGRSGGGQKKGQRPKCKHHAPKNRFGIAPGYRWDGVDRTNGFEGRLLRQGKEGEAAAEARYKWSVEDM
jgi:pre-mRNA-splicing factor CWC26|eukprot:COSAG06_NODE_6052_length_3134_cov_15.537068_2_plen_76_part_00